MSGSLEEFPPPMLSPRYIKEISEGQNSRTERAPLPRKPGSRKGYAPTRRGCFNCKKRKIRCNERHPECHHCIRAGLHCDYPANLDSQWGRTNSSNDGLRSTQMVDSTPNLPELHLKSKLQSNWTKAEEDLLMELRDAGKKFDNIAKSLPGRSSISCLLRYEDKKDILATLYSR
jgi:hypothetical protein